MTAFSFDFVSTRRDLLDGYEATRTRALRMRRPFRVLFGAIGLSFLAAAILSPLLERHMTTPWAPLLWLVLGLILTWRYVARAYFGAARIRASQPAEQRVVLTFQDSGIDIYAEGIGSFHRDWSELWRVWPEKRGISFVFRDGASHFLPNRVFKPPSERDALVRYASSFIATHPPR